MPLGTLLLVVATLIVSAGLTWYLSSARSAVSIMDHPNERSLHATAIPRTGGLGIWLGVAFGLGLSLIAARAGWIGGVWAKGAEEILQPDFHAILLATLFLAAMSLLDDVKHVSPVLRLLVQVSAAAGLVWGADFTIASFWVPGYGVLPLGTASYPITLLFIVWMANLYNFMDGLDGLAGGMAVFGFGVMGLLALLNGGAGIG
ncbi:partial putative undecaprenyl-phosphate N-acetylglucosaminyl 1-phosphate transferase, partial [Anaerolineae bacterium]